MTAFLRPDYEAIYYTHDLEALVLELPKLEEPKPRAVFLGHSFSQEEQDTVEKKLNDVYVVKSLPYDEALLEKLKDLEPEDKAPRIVKELLDRKRDQFTKMTPTAAAVAKNAV